MVPQRLIEQRPNRKCPYCNAVAKVEWRKDDDGDFEISACEQCGWVKIVDPDNPLLQGEARPDTEMT